MIFVARALPLSRKPKSKVTTLQVGYLGRGKGCPLFLILIPSFIFCLLSTPEALIMAPSFVETVVKTVTSISVVDDKHDAVPTSQIRSLNVEELLEELTLEEKVALTAGKDFWHTAPIERLSIPSIRLSDGPNGIRGTRFFDSVPAACLPCGTAIGATFDSDLAVKIGNLLADEAKAKGAHVILGPTMNIQRSPLGGRGFESFSEDPYLSGIMGGNYCKGVKEKDIVATLKHFVCNDQEHERMAVNAIVTERALREIYLEPFRIAVKMAQPGAVMTSYSKVNGTHVSENSRILQDILREEWKWDGLVMSDWYVDSKCWRIPQLITSQVRNLQHNWGHSSRSRP